jgi:biopolymer transport protein ExbD
LRNHPGSLCALILVAASLHAAQIRLEAKIFIEVQADGRHCRIGKERILCADSIAHLRDTLKLPPGTAVGVKAHQAAPFKEVRKVLDDVRNSGFAHPVSYLGAPDDSGRK